jgi:hypothetical protein
MNEEAAKGEAAVPHQKDANGKLSSLAATSLQAESGFAEPDLDKRSKRSGGSPLENREESLHTYFANS